uniref:IP19889p n=1 Tax=Drosophila melanogaster TaxID=7227 RepID=A8E6Y0_DROME|nr:IP19889p [Drosophila melanogaster]
MSCKCYRTTDSQRHVSKEKSNFSAKENSVSVLAHGGVGSHPKCNDGPLERHFGSQRHGDPSCRHPNISRPAFDEV